VISRLSRAEQIAAWIVAFLAAAVVAAYVLDAIGLTLHPIAILVLAVVTASVVAGRLGPSADGVAVRDARHTALAVVAIAAATAGWLLWLAWPHLLPIGGGSDLTHHLLLIDYIERTRHLVHDAALGPVLGEMAAYTPGAHLLVVLTASWLRTDGLHAVYPLLVLTVAFKTVFVFLIALRCTRPENGALPAVVAVLLLFVPRAYFLDSFVHDSYFAQVMCELFAVAMWWAIVRHDAGLATGTVAFFGLTGAAAFLTWPVWTGPIILALAAALYLERHLALPPPVRIRRFLLATAPIVLVAGMHAMRHFADASIAGAAGFVVRPTVATLGWTFLVPAIAGTIAAATMREARTVPLLLGAVAVQAAALVVVARWRGADAPYLALKMVYFAIYPLAVGGGVAVAALSGRGSWTSVVKWSAAIVIAIAAFGSVRGIRRTPPPVSEPLVAAGRWAHDRLPSNCVDYLVADDDSAYWLHLVALGNSRSAPRSLNPATFDPAQSQVRWIMSNGLPYAIADNFDALPRDIRTHVDVLARFGPAAVVQRRGHSVCSGIE
jgi:hypothetical protein